MQFRREALRNQQLYNARMDREALKNVYNKWLCNPTNFVSDMSTYLGDITQQGVDIYQASMDPKPQPVLTYDDKKCVRIHLSAYTDQLITNRERVLHTGFVPVKTVVPVLPATKQPVKNVQDVNDDSFAAVTNALYEREVAKGENDDEELFNVDEEITQVTPSWADIHRPRKPKFYNRVQTGYDWNRYNQVHYDANNPPPKVSIPFFDLCLIVLR